MIYSTAPGQSRYIYDQNVKAKDEAETKKKVKKPMNDDVPYPELW